MKFRPGLRMTVVMNGLPDEQVEVLLLVEAGSRSRLVARNVVEGAERALRCARDFIDARLEDLTPAAVKVAPNEPHPDDAF